MIEYYTGNPHQIQHFVKVHSFAKLIAEQEGASGELLWIIEAAALVHDIGIKPAQKQYGRSSGDLQEKLGPPVAEKLLSDLNFKQSFIERVCYLVGHHHTYETIDGLDYQILVEADFLVNFYEAKYDAQSIHKVDKQIFKTETGKRILSEMFK
ncbi:MAG: HD domain-containing protein [Thermotogota bacterium]